MNPIPPIRLSAPKNISRQYVEEIDFIQHLVGVWWANRKLHGTVRLAGVFNQLRHDIKRASDFCEYATLLRRGLCRLEDGHLRLGKTREKVERVFRSGLGFRTVDKGVALSTKDNRYGPIPKEGDLLLAVDKEPVRSFLSSQRIEPGSTQHSREWLAVQSLSFRILFPGEKLCPKKLILSSDNNTTYKINLQWRGEPLVSGPPFPCVSAKMLRAKVGLLRIRSFYCRDSFKLVSDYEFSCQFNKAASLLSKCDHVILDVRDNEGGRDEQARIAAAPFLTRPIEWLRYRHHKINDSRRPVQIEVFDPRSAFPHFHFNSKVWMLINSGTASTAEVFVDALRSRHTTVGQVTAGSVGNPHEFVLPYSGLSILIPTSCYFLGTGKPIEGSGIAPDICVLPALEDLKVGRDTVLEKAIHLALNR